MKHYYKNREQPVKTHLYKRRKHPSKIEKKLFFFFFLSVLRNYLQKKIARMKIYLFQLYKGWFLISMIHKISDFINHFILDIMLREIFSKFRNKKKSCLYIFKGYFLFQKGQY